MISSKLKRLFLFALGSLFFAALVPAGHAEAAEKTEKNVTTRVTADRMRYDPKGQFVIFEGNVHVNRPDFDLRSAKLTLYLSAAKNSGKSDSSAAFDMGGGKIDRIVAENDVHMTQEGRVGECEKATYTLADGKFVMEGNPILSEKDNKIRGKVINFYTRENRSEVLGGVKADFTTQEKQSPTEALGGAGK